MPCGILVFVPEEDMMRCAMLFRSWSVRRSAAGHYSFSNLHKKKIVDDAVCDLCGHNAETTTHLLFKCPMASSFWRAVGIQIPPGFTVGSLHTLQAPPHVPAAHFETLVLLCCWQLWKRQNGIVFRQEHMTLHQFLAGCKAEARLWVARLPRQDIAVGDQWCSFFSLAM